MAAQFKALGEDERAVWDKKAEQDKLRYQEEMKHYVPMEDPTGGGRKKQKKDPNAPKRNMSAYFLYSVHIRPTVKQENPDASFGEYVTTERIAKLWSTGKCIFYSQDSTFFRLFFRVARIISAQFKALDPKERAVWDQKAVADKERYQQEMAEYQG